MRKKFKRRPNNSGTVVKLKGNRRKPFLAKMSGEVDVLTGKRKQIVIGTFETELEALNALSLYQMTKKNMISDKEARELQPNLYDQINFRQSKMLTFAQIFNIIYDEELSKKSKSSAKGYNSWFKNFEPLHHRLINSITLQDLQEVFDRCKLGNGTKIHMKVLVSKIFEYAVIHQYISRDANYTEYIKCGQHITPTKHFAFSIDEISALERDCDDMSKLILIYIYSGLRATELLEIKREQVFIDVKCNDDGVERTVSYFRCGKKTSSGKNRVVPIHDSIKAHVVYFLDKSKNDVLFKMTYQTLQVKFKKKVEELGLKEHTVHDTRVTFTTLCQLNNVDVFSYKRVLGHKMKDITFDTYTDTVINKLYKEVNKIKK